MYPSKKKPKRIKPVSFIKTYNISQELFDKTIKTLRSRGRRKQEGLVLWAGIVNQRLSEAYILKSIIPRKGHWGGGVRLDHRVLLKLSDILVETGLILLAQVHTHPGDFGHSFGDERKSASYRLGYISIVVPNFALNELNDLKGCYVYEYHRNWRWNLLDEDDIKKRFKIEKSVMRI